MARGTDPTPGRQRLLSLGAVAGLAAATAFAFGRVFAGRAPTWELVAAALASVGIAALFERRGLLLATLASLVGLAFAVTWIVLPQTAWYGLPSLRTLRALGRALEFVGHQARVRVAPTAALPPLMLAALTAVWTASFSAHALAIRAGSPLLALLPMVVLVGFADTVLQDGARPIYAVTFLAAALAVVFADGLRRIRQWGPVWSAGRTGRLRTSVKGSRGIAAVIVLVTVLVPGLLPGFRSPALVDFSTDGGDGIDLDPFVSIHAQLDEQVAVDLFEVRAEEPSYWRLYALDQFDGSTWTSSDPDATARGQVLTTPTVLPVPPGEIPEGAPRLAQTFRILRDIDARYLPMAHPAEALTLPFGDITYDPFLAQALRGGGLDEGLEYMVTSRVVNPTGEELDDVLFLTPAQYGRYTQVSGSVDPRVRELAERWTRDEETPYRKIYALQRHFLDGSFLYSTEVEPKADADALLEFLTTSRRGFCQQFATAMAIMVRELGYPARVAVGYRSGTFKDGVFTVQTKDAHAWAEVFFPGYGWLAFEPTPSRPNPLAEPGTYLSPALPGSGNLPAGQGNENSLVGGGSADCLEVGPNGRPLSGQLCNSETRPTRSGDLGLPPGFLDGLEGRTEEPGYSVPYRWILLGLLAVLATLLVVVPIVKAGWRRVLLRRSRAPRDHVLAAYRVFDGEAADLGLGRREGETLEEHRARLAAAVAFSDGHLGRLTSAAMRSAYGPSAPTQEEARGVAEDAGRAIRDLRKDAGWLRRVVGTYRPGI